MMRVSEYEIDPILFQKGFSKGCGPFACESTCCAAGVYIDLKEKELILSHKETIKKYMDETQLTDDTRWFDAEVLDDKDFPSGKTIGTEVFNDKCVFLNKSGMCSLQITGTEEKLGRWALKPFFCVAFPITIDGGVVTFDDFLYQKTTCCSFIDNRETTLVEACKEELEFVLGKDGYEDLTVLQKEFVPDRPPLSQQ